MNDVSTRLFLEFLVDGIVDLYFLKDGDGDQYFIEKDDLLVELSNDEVEFFNKYGTLHKSNSNQYRGVLTYLFQEDEAIQKKAQRVQFNLKSLVNFTEDYHNAVCTDQECVNYTKNTKARVFMEPTVGMVYSSMGLNYSDDSNSSINPCFGINFRLVPVKSHYVWSLNLGFNVLKNNFNGSFFNTIFYERGQTFNISTDYLFLQVPIIVKYTYPAKRVQPEVYIGYSNGFLINAKHHITQDVSGVYKVEKESLNRKYHMGVLGGVGVKINLKNSNYLLVKGEYNYRIPGTNANYIMDHQKVRSVVMGVSYGFKL